MSQHDLTPAPETLEQMRKWAPGVAELSGERIQAELSGLLMGDNPRYALEVARDTGVLGAVLPELLPILPSAAMTAAFTTTPRPRTT
jgi:tRNA nucleotidyltransferase/poly(A) polymerase